MLHASWWSPAAFAIAIAGFAVEDLRAGDLPPHATKLLTAYEANFQIAVPIRIVMRRFGHEAGKEILTDQRNFRGIDSAIDFQTVIRRRANQGLLEEHYEQLLYDGKETLELKADFAGVGREITLDAPRGVKARVTAGVHPRLAGALERRIVEMESFVVSLPEPKTFRECAELADKVEIVEGARPKLILRMPDATDQSGVSYTGQEIHLEFDRDHGWWVKNALFRSTKSYQGNKYTALGRKEILAYHTLKNGGYFPKTIQVYHNANPEFKEQKGPRLEILSCTINPDPPLKGIELKYPAGLAVMREIVAGPDSLNKDQIIVAARDGTTQSFDNKEALDDFKRSAASIDKYKGIYTPEIGFDYLYTSIEAAKKAQSESQKQKPNTPERKKPWFETSTARFYGGMAMIMVVVILGIVWRRRNSAR